MPETIPERVLALTTAIRDLESQANRPAGCVQLLAVSKGQPPSAIQDAFNAGLRHFAENYLQEAQKKINALSNIDLCWHFIGSIQSNKSQLIARDFSWVHSVSRLSIAEKLNQARPDHLPPLNICLQIKLDNDESKSGIKPEDILELALKITQLPRLALRGLMVIASEKTSLDERYALFSTTANCMQSLNSQLHLSMDTLSMGMSDDLAQAIAAGSTMIRIGRRLFGERV